MRDTVYNITENCLLYTVYSCFCLGQHTTNHRATYFRDGKTNRNETPVIISVAIETSWFCLLIASVASFASVPTGEWRALLGGSAHVRCHCEMAFLYFLQIVPWQRTWIVAKHVWIFSQRLKHLTSLHSAPHNVNTCVWMRRCITPLCRVSCDTYSDDDSKCCVCVHTAWYMPYCRCSDDYTCLCPHFWTFPISTRDAQLNGVEVDASDWADWNTNSNSCEILEQWL